MKTTIDLSEQELSQEDNINVEVTHFQGESPLQLGFTIGDLTVRGLSIDETRILIDHLMRATQPSVARQCIGWRQRGI